MTKEKMLAILENKKKFQQDLDAFLSTHLPGEEVQELHRIIAEFYAQKLTGEMDKLAADNGWTQQTYEGWLQEHNRTPYK